MKSSFSLSNGVMNFKTIIFIISSVVLSLLYVFTSFPVFNETVYSTDPDADNECTITASDSVSINSDCKKITTAESADNTGNTFAAPDNTSAGSVVTVNLLFKDPVMPSVSDYVLIRMKAENIEGIAYPAGSIAVNLATQDYRLTQDNGSNDSSENDGSEYQFTYRERSRIYIDGLWHNYYIPVGENRYYSNIPEDITENSDPCGKNAEREKSRNSLTLEVPEINGVKIEIEKIEIKKRTFFALDSRVNYFIRNYFKISHINRYQTPVYFFLVIALFLYLLYLILSRLIFKKPEKENLCGTGNNKGNVRSYTQSDKIIRLHKAYKKPLTILIMAAIALTALTTVYFLGTNVLYSVKGYWDSYKKYILEGRLDRTYYGFYNFEKFIFWLDENIPAGKNLIVTVRGEPVYIMAEMAYNLYPRDIRFINITGKSREEILSEIMQNNNTEAGMGKEDAEKKAVENGGYKYIIFLSESDIVSSEKLQFINRYRKTGGYLYKLNNY